MAEVVPRVTTEAKFVIPQSTIEKNTACSGFAKLRRKLIEFDNKLAASKLT